MSRTPRKPELVDMVRNGMLDAASRVFARKGYSAATMAEIALEADYTAPAFYKYFKGKEVLFEALLERAQRSAAALLEDLPPVREGATFEEEAAVLFRAAFELIDRHADTFTMLQASAAALPSARIAARHLAVTRRNEKRLASRLAAAAGSLRIGRIAATEAAAFMNAFIHGLFLQWAAQPALRRGRFIDQLPLALELFLHGVSGRRSKK
jgi:AcrR family transcriptional regulator